MQQPSKRAHRSLLFCFGTILCYGTGLFLASWRAYRDEQNFELLDQPLSVSIILMGLGALVPTVIFSVMWTWRPFKWIKPVWAIYSCLAGVLASFAHVQYTVSSNEGVPAVIAGPISGFCYLVPPLWYWLWDRNCMTRKTGLGFVLSFTSLISFSGLISESISYTVTFRGWFAVTMVALGFGFEYIFQEKAVRNMNFEQFPQIIITWTFGHTLCCIISAAITCISDCTSPSNYTPFGNDKFLMIGLTTFNTFGEGFYFMCLFYADDVNLMVALSSLYIVVPVILGSLILHEQVTWNIILGLCCALVGAIILALEANREHRTYDRSRTMLDSISTSINECPERRSKANNMTSISSEPLIVSE